MDDASNIPSSELDEATKEKLKGDAIGDTLYRESFVLKTLLQLSELNWNDQVEEDLCYLWDMTTEVAVCKYLFKLSFPSLVGSALMKYDEPRFVEIIIGILANILCADCEEKKIATVDIKIILNELETDDSLILVQVDRVIIALAHLFDKLPFITREEMDKLNFILNNSTHQELLIKTIETISKITEGSNFKLNQELVNTSLYEGLMVGFETVFDTNFELDSNESQIALKFLLQSITNICVYMNKTADEDLLLNIQHCSKFEKIVCKTLEYFSSKENLLPLTDNITYYFNALSYILLSVEYCFQAEIFKNLCRILYNLYDCRDELSNSFKDILEIISYFVHSVENNLILGELKKLPYKNGICVLNSLKANEKKLDYNITDHLKFLFKEYK